MIRFIRFSSLAIFIIISTSASSLMAAGNLPQYCDHEYRKTAQWTHGLALHHYCSGLDNLNKFYTAKTKEGKDYNLIHAMSDFNYALNVPSAHNPILGEQYISRGIAFLLYKKYGEAIRDWHKALEINPKLGRAYTELADYFERNKQTKKSLEIVALGLQHLPGDKGLQRRYIRLGGKLPFPEPLEKPSADSSTLEKQPMEKATENKPQNNPILATKPTSTAEDENSTPSNPEATPPESDIRGTAKNPYCRFCPE